MENVIIFGIHLFNEFVECKMTILLLKPRQFQINSGVLNINKSNKYNLHRPVTNLAYFQKSTSLCLHQNIQQFTVYVHKCD